MLHARPDEASALAIAPTSPQHGALLMVATAETLERLSLLVERAGHLATPWGHGRGPPETATLVRNRIAFVEVLPDWTGAIEMLCRFKDQAFIGVIVLLGGEDAATLERVHTVGLGLGLRMAIALGNVFEDSQVTDLLVVPLPAVAAPMLVFDVREALAKNWLELWYQPQINLKRRSLCGVEGLLRLRHPVLGLFPPPAFIPSAHSDPYAAMTAFVLASAGRDWRALGRIGARLPVSINASVNMVLDDSLIPMIDAAWPKRALRPPITIEIAEYETLGETSLVQAAAERLRSHGAQLSIDDFGNGLSGFARLRDLPCCEIKLDRSFVTGCSNDSRLLALCEATVNLARQFGVRAVAEGVETAEDCATIERLGFDCAQGYFFARPMPFAEFHDELKKRNHRHRVGGLVELGPAVPL